MAPTIRNREVERPAEEVARLAGETKTEAVEKALEMRLRELQRKQIDRLIRFLERGLAPDPAGAFGKRYRQGGRTAGLNFGDRLSYALARAEGEPNFERTDLAWKPS